MAADGVQATSNLLLEIKVDLLAANVNDVKMLLLRRRHFAGRRGIASGDGVRNGDGLSVKGLLDGRHVERDGVCKETRRESGESVQGWTLGVWS